MRPWVTVDTDSTMEIKLPKMSKSIVVGTSCLLIAGLTALLFMDDSSHVEALTLTQMGTTIQGTPRTVEQFKEKKEEMKNTAATASPTKVGALTFNSAESALAKELNQAVYDISVEYLEYDKKTPEKYKDPLFALALTCVEWGGVADTSVCWSAALPSKYLNKSELSADAVREVGIADVASNATAQGKQFWYRQYWGPLQMTAGYGVNLALKPADLNKSEEDVLKQKLGSVPGFIASSGNLNTDKKAGDRFNWPDGCNRTYGYMRYNWERFEATGKTSLIDNKYAYMALMAVAHNSGEGIFAGGDGTGWASRYNWWQYPSNVACYTFCQQLSQDEIIKAIKNKASENIKAYRAGNVSSLLTRPDNGTIQTWLNKWESLGLLDTSNYLRGKLSNDEKICYPVQVLYAYFLLYNLYNGE